MLQIVVVVEEEEEEVHRLFMVLSVTHVICEGLKLDASKGSLGVTSSDHQCDTFRRSMFLVKTYLDRDI